MWPYTNNLRMISHKSTISSGLTRSEGWVSSLVSFIFDRNGKRKQKATTDPAGDRSAAEKGRKGGSDRDRRIHNKYRAEDLKIFSTKIFSTLGFSKKKATEATEAVIKHVQTLCGEKFAATAPFRSDPRDSVRRREKFAATAPFRSDPRDSVRRREKFAATVSHGSDQDEDQDQDGFAREKFISWFCHRLEKKLKRDGASQKEMTKATTKLAQRLHKAM